MPSASLTFATSSGHWRRTSGNCAGVNAATGRDVLPLFDEAFDEFEAELDQEIEAIQQGSA